MALSQAALELRAKKWRKRVLREYVAKNRLASMQGESMNDPLMMVRDLGKNEGEEIFIPLVLSARGKGKRGNATLSGFEERIDNHGDKVKVELIRNAWAVMKADQQKTLIDLVEQIEPLAKDWLMTTLIDDWIKVLLSTNLDGVTTHEDTLAADRNAFLQANLDRVLFGSNIANSVSGIFATALATVDGTNDKMKFTTASLLKRMAAETKKSPHTIRPAKTEDDDKDYWIALLGPRAFRDLENDPVMDQAYRDAEKRGKDNRLFTGGEMMKGGIIFKQIDEIPILEGVGDSGIDVEPWLLMGAQAGAYALAEKPHEIEERRDFKAITAAGVEETRGVKKLFFNKKMHGCLMGYVAAEPDA